MAGAAPPPMMPMDGIVITTEGVRFNRLDCDPSAPWYPVPGPVFDDGLSAVRFRGALWVFGTSNKKVQFNIFNGVAWGGWATIAEGDLLSKPGVAVHGDALHIFGRGTDNGVYYNVLSDAWSGWKQFEHGGFTLSAPAVVSAHGVLHVIVHGTDHQLYHSAGAPWKSLGVATSEAPSLTSLDHTLLLLFKSGDSNALFTSSFEFASGHWTPPAKIDGETPNSPTLSRQGPATIALVRGTNGVLYRAFVTDGRFLWGAVPGAGSLTHAPTLA
jgi:hypothetical protein